MSDISIAQLFSPPNDPSLLTFGIYDPWLVGLSVLVAIFSSWMGLQMAGQAAAAHSRALRSTAMFTGSLALGSGVWAMHFIGMLAFDLCTSVDYDHTITIASMLPSIGASFVALSLIGRQQIGGWQLLIGGVLVGAGIGTMHYAGMAAMEMSLAQRYDPWMFGLSIVVAVVLATLALWVRFGLHSIKHRIGNAWRLLISAVVMGCAIAGMHYTGMAAARFVGQVPAGSVGSTNVTFIALAVTLTTVAFTVFVLAVNGVLRYREMFRQLSQSESWMRTLLATAVDGVVTIDSGGIIHEFNAAAEGIFGWTRSEIVGQNVALLVADHEQSNKDGLLAYLNGKDSRVIGTEGDVLGRRKDGKVIPIRRALGHARLGGTDMFVCFITDISERRQREEDLRQAKERAEQAAASRAAFLANMSHEIRTPMNSILGFTDILLHDDLKPEQRRHLDTVRNAGRSLLRLLNEILDTAKLDRGAMELEMSDFDLVVLIDELMSTLGADARRKNLKLDIVYDKNVPRHVHGDDLRLRQVLTNLLGNAVKFTEVGRVALHVGMQDGQLYFAVSDSGIGIAADRLASIFDPFTQADPSMSRRFGGTGLGTTISKQLVELMGGRIWVESTLGEGSTFHVLLPLVAALPPPTTDTAQPAIALPALRILAADDVAQNLELLTLLLGKQGHSVEMASDGALAVKLAAEKHFDVILMDVQMPNVDGLEATRQIRAAEATRRTARVPIIAMTASVLETDREATRDADMDGFAAKPVDPLTLTSEIARVLGLSEVGAGGTAQEYAAAPVLDSAQGLRRWADRQDAYRQALQKFTADHGDSAQKLNGLAAAGDFAAMQGLAHRIRGVAANLGLVQLSAELALLELAAGKGDATTTNTLLAAMPEQVARARDAIDAFSGPAPATAAELAATTLDSERIESVERLSGKLMQSLQRGAIDDEALKQLTAMLAGHPASARIATVWKAVDDFEFDLAQTRLAALVAEIVPAPSTAP